MIRTERLLLRPVQMRDAAELAQAFNTPSLARQTGTIPYPVTADYLRLRIRHWIKCQGNSQFGFAVRRGGRVIGQLGFGHVVNRRWNLGYSLAQPLWGMGLGTEAVQAFCFFGFRTLKIKEIEASVFIDNPASAKVLEKIGFQGTVGRASEWSVARGVRVPVNNYVLTRERMKLHAA